MSYDALLRLLRERRSIRRFAERAIPRADLCRVLEAGRWAPSNHNRQPWRFLVLEEPPRIRALAAAIGRKVEDRLQALPAVAAAYRQDFLQHATLFREAAALVIALHKHPVQIAASLLAGLPHPALVSGEPLSVAMAVQNLVLAAHALGLGSCVLTAPLLGAEAIASYLDLPRGYELTCFVALGYPDESPEPPRRKPLDQIAEFSHTAPAPEAPAHDQP